MMSLTALWAMNDQLFHEWRSLHGVNSSVSSDERVALRQRAESSDGVGYTNFNGTAILNFVGPLMKSDSWVLQFFGGTSLAKMRRAVIDATNDPDVHSLLLRIDSPGGTVVGTADLADAIYAARRTKAVFAYIEDVGASGAYWIASQADKVFCNSTALVGSIGTYLVLEDVSEMASQLGVKVHVIRAGEFKGTGTPGTEITPEQIAMLQDRVNALNEHFLKGVARGRNLKLEQVRAVADGRVHIGKAAADIVAAGGGSGGGGGGAGGSGGSVALIDGVQSLEQTIKQLQRQSKSGAGNNMSSPRNNYAAAAFAADDPAQGIGRNRYSTES